MTISFPTTAPEVLLQDVSLHVDRDFSLKDLDITVAAKESVVIIGPSDAGKTVLLKTIAGLYRPNRGRIEIRGHNTNNLSSEQRYEIARMSMLFQRSALFDSLTIWENITFRLSQSISLSKSKAIGIAEEKLHSVGLEPEIAVLYPSEISGGMQKRVGIARAIADDPNILLLDEPTAGLDPVMTNIINDLIIQNVRRIGATVLSITSNLEGARRIADRIIMMNAGTIVWQGSTKELEKSSNAYLRQFVDKTTEGPMVAGQH
tara:strand:- start:1289 stop:2071 length:783 start_codon:yes stop_codon:yes gene_type:complete